MLAQVPAQLSPRPAPQAVPYTSQGQRPSERSLHPKVMSFIADRSLYGFPSKTASSALSDPAAAIAAAGPAQLLASHPQPRPPPTPESIAAEISDSLPTPPRKCHVVVLFGVHGVGKGTVADALCQRHGYAHVSFGR
jgi:hypothetical protein